MLSCPQRNNNIKSHKGNHMDVVYQSLGETYFQEEILMDILCRLPLRSHLRFKCVSKFWNTLISDPCFAMKTKLSLEERRDCTCNIVRYLFHLDLGLYRDRKADRKEFMKTCPLSQNTRVFLGCHPGSSEDDNTEEDDNNNEDDNADEDEEHDNENETSASEEYDSEEEVGDVESGDESGNDDDDDDDEKGNISAEEWVNRMDDWLSYMLHLVPFFEGMYKDRKADLKEIQEKHPLSRHSRELLGYDSGSDLRPPDVDNTKDERAASGEHDSKEVDAAKSVDGPDDDDDVGDDDASDNAGVAA